jgi:hypothetical protein
MDSLDRSKISNSRRKPSASCSVDLTFASLEAISFNAMLFGNKVFKFNISSNRANYIEFSICGRNIFKLLSKNELHVYRKK